MTSRWYKSKVLEATNGPVAWPVEVDDDFDVSRLCLMFATKPEAVDKVTILIRSALGSEYDCLIRTEDPNNRNSLVVENINGITKGDRVEVVYANSGGVTVRGTATIER